MTRDKGVINVLHTKAITSATYLWYDCLLMWNTCRRGPLSGWKPVCIALSWKTDDTISCINFSEKNSNSPSKGTVILQILEIKDFYSHPMAPNGFPTQWESLYLWDGIEHFSFLKSHCSCWWQQPYTAQFIKQDFSQCVTTFLHTALK